jgi:D-aminopeptidase
MILAMGAARCGIPLIMVSGDDQLEKEIERYLPWVKYAVVKHSVDRSKAVPFDREEVNRRIEKAAREALLALDSARLPEITSSTFRFVLTFQDETQARYVGWLQDVGPGPDAASVEIRAGDFEEGYRSSLRLISAAGLVGRLQAYQRVVNDQSNAADLRDAVSEIIGDRWLHPWPARTAASGTGTARRYWGAR